MDRRERRRRARERKKLEEKFRKETLRVEAERQASSTRVQKIVRPFLRLVSGTKFLKGVIAFTLSLFGGWALFRPHISVEPYLPLNPVDPYTTQFAVRNESKVFDVYSVNCVCWPRAMQSGNNFNIVSLAPLPNMHHEIKLLGPGASSMVDCPAAIGGLGSYSGQVLYAELEIEVTYSQSWWPFVRTERYPFVSMRDVQGAVHWMHTTPDGEKPILSLLNQDSRKR